MVLNAKPKLYYRLSIVHKEAKNYSPGIHEYVMFVSQVVMGIHDLAFYCVEKHHNVLTGVVKLFNLMPQFEHSNIFYVDIVLKKSTSESTVRTFSWKVAGLATSHADAFLSQTSMRKTGQARIK